MDILKLIGNLGSENLESLLGVISNLFQSKTPSTPQQEPPPQTAFDANNPYWSLPTYSPKNTQNNSTMQCIVPPENMHSTQQNSDKTAIFEIIKTVLPLLMNNKSAPPPQVSSTLQSSESEILKLKKTK